MAGFTCRWATQGFDFLQAIEPAFISALPEDDFLVCLLSFSLTLYFAPCAGMACNNSFVFSVEFASFDE